MIVDGRRDYALMTEVLLVKSHPAQKNLAQTSDGPPTL